MHAAMEKVKFANGLPNHSPNFDLPDLNPLAALLPVFNNPINSLKGSVGVTIRRQNQSWKLEMKVGELETWRLGDLHLLTYLYSQRTKSINYHNKLQYSIHHVYLTPNGYLWMAN